jgi:adenine/guanine phosphoribosyltransferase-like PRPP-binding protein
MPPAPVDGFPWGFAPNRALTMLLADAIRTMPDYPKKGILFRDITTLLGDAKAFRRTVDELVQPWAGTKIDKVAGVALLAAIALLVAIVEGEHAAAAWHAAI